MATAWLDAARSVRIERAVANRPSLGLRGFGWFSVLETGWK